MGSPKPKTVGGGSATNTATAFNDFLLQGLTTGQFGNVADPRVKQSQFLQNNQLQNNGNPLLRGLGQQMAQQGVKLGNQAYNNQPGQGAGQSLGQTSLIGNALNSLLGSNPNGMIDSNQFLSQLGNINANAPQFQNAQLGQLGTDYNPQSLLGQFGDVFGGPQSNNLGDIAKALGGLGIGGGGGGAGGDFSYTPGKLLNYDINSPEFQAISQLSALRKKEDVANLRGRFGLVGGSLGSGASNAEGQYLAQANPQETLALGQLGRQMQEMDLGQQQINNNLRTNLLGQQVNAGLGNAQLGLQGQGQLLNALSNIYGQNLNYNMGRGNSLLGAGQNDIQNQLQAFLANSGNQQTNNQNAFNQSQAANQFNLSNFGQQSQNSLGVGGIGAQLQQLAQSGQLGALNQIFGALGQSNQLGTPQAQTVMQPSAFSQALGAATGLAGVIGGIATGNPMAIAGGAGQLGGSFGGGGQLLGGSTPFMNSNGGLFQGQNLGIGGRMSGPTNFGLNPSDLMLQTGGPMQQTAFPNMMNAQGLLSGFNGGLSFPSFGGFR